MEPAQCQTCRTAPCLPSDSWSVINCTLYTDKACQACILCSRENNEFIDRDCSEFADRTCQPCARQCYFDEVETTPCGGVAGFDDRVCEQCHASCFNCTGTTNLDCDACAAGRIKVDLGEYGGTAGQLQCVPHEQCAYTDWNPENFTVCSAPCGGGVRERSRELQNLYPCLNPLPTYEQEACNTELCGEFSCAGA